MQIHNPNFSQDTALSAMLCTLHSTKIVSPERFLIISVCLFWYRIVQNDNILSHIPLN